MCVFLFLGTVCLNAIYIHVLLTNTVNDASYGAVCFNIFLRGRGSRIEGVRLTMLYLPLQYPQPFNPLVLSTNYVN